jgi:endonuclease/exonuclease/phosphatase (EEP) superfamily protein YafD
MIVDQVKDLVGPAVLCGDLNTGHSSPEIAPLTLSGLVDCGATGNEPTYRADRPTERIDFVWTRGMRTIEVAVLPVQYSDHRPVVTDLMFETE